MLTYYHIISRKKLQKRGKKKLDDCLKMFSIVLAAGECHLPGVILLWDMEDGLKLSGYAQLRGLGVSQNISHLLTAGS